MNKLVALTLAIFMLASTITGCSGTSSETPLAATKSNSVTVIDQASRTVEVGDVNTIAVCWYMADDFVLAMGLGDKLIAIGPYDDFHVLVKPNIPNLGTVGRGRPDMELLASMGPDLLIHTVGDTQNIAAVEALGIPMIQIDPETIDKTMEAYRIVGLATGASERADFLKNIYSELTGKAKGLIGETSINDRPSFVILGSDPGKIADGKMMQAEMIENGGGRNVAGKNEGTGFWPEVGVEQVFTWNPDYILISQTANYSVEDILGDPSWADLRAVKNGNVFLIPGQLHNWENPGMGTALGTLWAAKIFYSGKLTDTEFDNIVKNFYRQIYGIEVTSEIIGY